LKSLTTSNAIHSLRAGILRLNVIARITIMADNDKNSNQGSENDPFIKPEDVDRDLTILDITPDIKREGMRKLPNGFPDVDTVV
jgi:hypothetical protein